MSNYSIFCFYCPLCAWEPGLSVEKRKSRRNIEEVKKKLWSPKFEISVLIHVPGLKSNNQLINNKNS